MNSKGHLIISILKSGLRILGTIGVMSGNPVELLAITFFGAEILGILEELVDRR